MDYLERAVVLQVLNKILFRVLYWARAREVREQSHPVNRIRARKLLKSRTLCLKVVHELFVSVNFSILIAQTLSIQIFTLMLKLDFLECHFHQVSISWLEKFYSFAPIAFSWLALFTNILGFSIVLCTSLALYRLDRNIFTDVARAYAFNEFVSRMYFRWVHLNFNFWGRKHLNSLRDLLLTSLIHD